MRNRNTTCISLQFVFHSLLPAAFEDMASLHERVKLLKSTKFSELNCENNQFSVPLSLLRQELLSYWLSLCHVGKECKLRSYNIMSVLLEPSVVV
jgi:hypothetical protein